jgi:UPF0271 protein
VEGSEELAVRYCQVVRDRFPGVRVFALAGGTVERVAKGVEVWGELFAERGYTEEGGLVPRGQAGDLIGDPDEIARRVVGWEQTNWLGARTVCVHADSPGSVAIARAVAKALLGGSFD